MKLDRNINPDGGGKYALIKMRRVREIISGATHQTSQKVKCAISVLEDHGCIHRGDEGPGEQFFVMKYKDRFTAAALRAYVEAIRNAMVPAEQIDSMREYADEIAREAVVASNEGSEIPD